MDQPATGTPARFGSVLATVATAAARWPLPVVVVALLLTVGSGVFAARHFAIDTDSAKLISADVDWRRRSAAFDAAFPQNTDLIAIVVDGATPELAERAAATLAARLAARTDLFHVVRRPDGGPFFERDGILFLDTAEVRRTTEQLVASQAVIGTLAADPSVRGLVDTLTLALEGVRRGETTFDKLRPGLAALATTAEGVLRDQPAPLSWRSLLGGAAPDARELRRFVLVQPVLDYAALEPGARASDAIRATARDAGFDQAHGVRVRLTGNIPMADEEFGTLQDHAVRNALVMAAALVAMLWAATRSVRATLAIVATLVVGLAVTAAIGLAIFHALNLISVAFAVLFVGLGVDFGIQFAVSYRAHADAAGNDGPGSAGRAARQVGTALALAALAIAAGFFAFEPTDYRGVSELGVVAGIGMGVAFVGSLTLLPALLAVARVGGLTEGATFGFFGGIERTLQRRRRVVLVVAGVLALASLATLPFVRFDFNPLHLRSASTEGVATLLDLSRDPLTTPNTIDVIAPNRDAAIALAQRLSALPEVDHALTVASFVPTGQAEKLALIADASTLLDPTLNPGDVKPPPGDAEVARALRDGATALVHSADEDATDARGEARRLAAAFTALASGPPAQRTAFTDALVPGLQTTLGQLRALLQAAPVTLESLPRDLVDEWVSTDGRARVEVYPKTSATSGSTSNALDPAADAALTRFIAAVRAVAPEATGTPISIAESARTIVHAFLQAGVWASIAITILLALTLRRVRDVVVTLASLLLGGVVTLALCVVLDIPLNYANIIALPLLFGIGVAFNIYFVVAWRHGVRDLLSTSIARAVVFSALTTATAFGSLWLSSHPGTASMGKLLALSLACTLAAALFVLPALLGPPAGASLGRR